MILVSFEVFASHGRVVGLFIKYGTASPFLLPPLSRMLPPLPRMLPPLPRMLPPLPRMRIKREVSLICQLS